LSAPSSLPLTALEWLSHHLLYYAAPPYSLRWDEQPAKPDRTTPTLPPDHLRRSNSGDGEDLGGPRPAITAGGAAAPASACSDSAPEIQSRRARCPPLGLIIAATADAEPLQSPPDNLGRHRHWPRDTAA